MTHHTCHWPTCTRGCPPKMFMCKAHWFTLPKYIRDSIWRTYLPGQENTKNPSAAYLRVAGEAQRWALAWEAAKVKTQPGLF